MDAWTRTCVAQTGSQNEFEIRGQRYFWEISRKEHADGAITGTIYRMLPVAGDKHMCLPAGSFRINGDGTVKRGPALLKAAVRS